MTTTNTNAYLKIKEGLTELGWVDTNNFVTSEYRTYVKAAQHGEYFATKRLTVTPHGVDVSEYRPSWIDDGPNQVLMLSPVNVSDADWKPALELVAGWMKEAADASE